MPRARLPAKEVGQALLAQVDKVPADRKALVIAALADRGDAAALPAALEAAKSANRRGPRGCHRRTAATARRCGRARAPGRGFGH